MTNPIIQNLLDSVLTPSGGSLSAIPVTPATPYVNAIKSAKAYAQAAPKATTTTTAPATSGGGAPSSGSLVDRIAAAIRKHESGGNYNAYNPNGGGARGAYQFIPSTWRGVNQMFGGNMSWSKQNQDKVAKAYIQHILDQYHTSDPGVVAAVWYTGHYTPGHTNYVPAPGAGNRQTVASYMQQLRNWVNGG